jgi:hypothetical protein
MAKTGHLLKAHIRRNFYPSNISSRIFFALQSSDHVAHDQHDDQANSIGGAKHQPFIIIITDGFFLSR